MRTMSKDEKLRVQKYEKAIIEAERFIERAKEYLTVNEITRYRTNKLNASAKRASSDLSEALYAIRRSDWDDLKDIEEIENAEGARRWAGVY